MCSHTSGVVIYSRFHQNPFMSHGGRHLPCPIILAIGFCNSLYYCTSRAILFCVVFRLEYEYIVKGYMFQKGRLKITVSKIFKVSSCSIFTVENLVSFPADSTILIFFGSGMKIAFSKSPP